MSNVASNIWKCLVIYAEVRVSGYLICLISNLYRAVCLSNFCRHRNCGCMNLHMALVLEGGIIWRIICSNGACDTHFWQRVQFIWIKILICTGSCCMQYPEMSLDLCRCNICLSACMCKTAVRTMVASGCRSGHIASGVSISNCSRILHDVDRTVCLSNLCKFVQMW